MKGHTHWSCAPGTEEGVEPEDLLCSRNARPQTPLAHPLARLGVPVGGRVRRPRAVEDQSAPIPEEITSELGRNN